MIEKKLKIEDVKIEEIVDSTKGKIGFQIKNFLLENLENGKGNPEYKNIYNKLYSKYYRTQKSEYFKEKLSDYKKNNKTKIKDYMKNYMKDYYQNNKLEIIEKTKKRIKSSWEKDPEKRLKYLEYQKQKRLERKAKG